jgi:hypothetical protein
MKRLLLAFATICAAHAAQNDYFLHFTADNMGPVILTAGSPDATPLVPPSGACGMRFQKTAGPESDDIAIGTEWIMPYDSGGPDIPDGAFDAYLGLPGCGWDGLTLDPENGGQIGPPGGLAGTLAVYEVYGYWVDSNGDKLVYKNPPCLPDCIGSNDFVSGNGWSFAGSHLKTAKLLLGGTKVVRPADLVFLFAERSMTQLSRDVGDAISRRRKSFVAGDLERSIRASEDDALRRLSTAAKQQRSCRTLHQSGDLKSALIACDAALTSTSLARAALEAAVEWMRW